MNNSKTDHRFELETLFKEKLIAVSERIAEGNNAYIRRKPNVDKLILSRAVTAKDETLTEKFFTHFNRKNIANVIHKVNTET